MRILDKTPFVQTPETSAAASYHREEMGKRVQTNITQQLAQKTPEGIPSSLRDFIVFVFNIEVFCIKFFFLNKVPKKTQLVQEPFVPADKGVKIQWQCSECNKIVASTFPIATPDALQMIGLFVY